MKISLRQAVKHFFSQSSFDQIYQEAIANAIDAGARNITIAFEANSLSDVNSFKLSISDDGVGFTEERFKKFSKLMDVEDEDIKHKGLGRLVYLFYFDKVEVESYFDKNKHRLFSFDEKLNDEAEDSLPDIIESENPSGATLRFEGYNLSRLYKKEFVDPKWIKTKLLKKFVVPLFILKKKEENFCITIKSKIANHESVEQIKPESIPALKDKTFVSSYTTDGEMTMYYSVAENGNTMVITAMSIDGRSEPMDIFAEGNEPNGYEMFFILYADSYQGHIDASRQKLEFPTTDLKNIQKEFRKQINAILKEKAPKVVQSHQKETERLQSTFPHLEGLFDEDEIGISSRSEVIKEAQRKFMQQERELLFKAGALNDSDYFRSLELAGRTLTQYVTFRQYVIDKLKKVDSSDKEEIIHNLIVPKRQVINAPNSYLNIYRNNIWIFDDKFMTFNVVLSEKETTELLRKIDPECEIRDIDRPDIAIIFSDDPKTTAKVDVVIIELKKKGLKGGENIKVEYQLEQRARALYPLFESKIQSMWLYGVTQLNNDYKSTLDTMGYRPLFSKGTVYVNPNPITITTEPERITVPAVRYIMDMDAVINDADARNRTFMDLIKERMKTVGEE
jgi:anti-sigma regulatory factor (Ser/Thr protein kinase)